VLIVQPLKIMQLATPTTIEPKAAVENGEAHISVAVLGAMGDFNALSSTILLNSILAGLRRRKVAIKSNGDFFLKLFSVMIFTVPIESKSAAFAAVKDTLGELGLLECSTIAHYTADQVWLTNYGISVSASFEDLFVRPEYIEAARANIAEIQRTKAERTAAFMADIYRLLAKAQSATDSK
jgi:hypothetical protein